MTNNLIECCIRANKCLAVATSDVNALYDKLKADFPKAKFTKDHSNSLVILNQRMRNDRR